MKRDPLLTSFETVGLDPNVSVSDAQAALFQPDPLGDFVTNFKASALPPKPDKGESTTISASGDTKWRKCMAKNFGGRGEMSKLIYRALEYYFDASGAIVENDGTIKSKQFSLDV